MAWNEPGGNKDPWSRKPKGDSELDKILNEFSKSFKDLLGGSSGDSGSSKKNTSFNGKAEKIMFFNDEKIHLIGDASIKYENISISSNIIIFNPRTGKISSE